MEQLRWIIIVEFDIILIIYTKIGAPFSALNGLEHGIWDQDVFVPNWLSPLVTGKCPASYFSSLDFGPYL